MVKMKKMILALGFNNFNCRINLNKITHDKMARYQS